MYIEKSKGCPGDAGEKKGPEVGGTLHITLMGSQVSQQG